MTWPCHVNHMFCNQYMCFCTSSKDFCLHTLKLMAFNSILPTVAQVTSLGFNTSGFPFHGSGRLTF